MTKPTVRLSKSLGAACLLASFLIAIPAAAQQDNVLGRWSFSSPARPGSPAYAGYFVFAPDGGEQFFMPGVACVGSYQFDGETLTSQLSACQSCTGGFCTPAPELAIEISAPAQFQGPYAINWLTQPPIVLHRN